MLNQLFNRGVLGARWKRAELLETESEEAAVVADGKRAELREVYAGKVRGSGLCEDDDEVVQETTSEVAGKFECSDEEASDVKVPARINDPVSNDRIWLGTYDTLADALRCFRKEKTVIDTKMKRAEFEEQFMGKADVNIVEDESHEICDGVLAKRKQFLKQSFGVSKKGKRWQARIRHPKLKFKIHLGYFNTPEEAVLVVKKKRSEFKEMLKAEEGLREKRRVHEFEGRKLPCGVTRQRGKFRVRLWHPELKKFASFGYYNTCDEAAVVADRKRAELRELCGGKVRGSGEFPCGVTREHGKFRVRLWHPELKKFASFGYYRSCDEAAVVADRKRAELREVSGGKVRGSGECESEVTGNFECPDEQTSDVKVPAGVRRVRSDEWVARIKDPASNERIRLGTCDTAEEAIRSYDKKRAVQMGYEKLDCEFVHGSRTSNIELGTSNSACIGDKRVIDQMSRRKTTCSLDKKFNSKKAKLYSEPTGAEKALDTTACYYSPTSVLDSENSSHSSVTDDPNDTMVDVPFNLTIKPGNVSKLNCGVVDVPDKLECEFVQGSPTSNIEPGMSVDKRLIDKESQKKSSCGLDFDEAVSAGFINEYGQLVGKYRVLDEQLYLGLPDEIVASSG
ncbi:uncharacterized protein LOC141598925 [Silene latifolia]|uniref:uncharacterized protein LOC141598925 n=1 Tax=Silene latifolia TaxID=37657 RepID=UPI003D78039F